MIGATRCPRRAPSAGISIGKVVKEASGECYWYRPGDPQDRIDTQKMIVEDKYGQCDEYFTDIGKSGALGLDKRLGLAEALESLRKGDELIVAKLDRLARDSYLSAYHEQITQNNYPSIFRI